MAMDHLQETYDRGDTITGVRHRLHTTSTSCSPACSPATLNIVGARPAMGKTAFGLGMATHVAQHVDQAGAGVLARDGPRTS